MVSEHDLTECVERVGASPAACRRVLRALTFLAETDLSPRWEPVLEELTRLASRVEAARKARQPRRYRYQAPGAGEYKW